MWCQGSLLLAFVTSAAGHAGSSDTGRGNRVAVIAQTLVDPFILAHNESAAEAAVVEGRATTSTIGDWLTASGRGSPNFSRIGHLMVPSVDNVEGAGLLGSLCTPASMTFAAHEEAPLEDNIFSAALWPPPPLSLDAPGVPSMHIRTDKLTPPTGRKFDGAHAWYEATCCYLPPRPVVEEAPQPSPAGAPRPRLLQFHSGGAFPLLMLICAAIWLPLARATSSDSWCAVPACGLCARVCPPPKGPSAVTIWRVCAPVLAVGLASQRAMHAAGRCGSSSWWLWREAAARAAILAT